MTKEEKLERIRRKKIAQRRRRIKRRRRAYALLLICVFVGVAIIFYRAGAKKGEKSVSGNALATAGAGAGESTTDSEYSTGYNADYSLGEYTGLGTMTDSISNNSAFNPRANMKLDVSTGVANVDLKIVEENGGDVLNSAKDAMQNRAYFTGCSTTVNNILTMYAPDGKWHAIKTTSSQICVFYSGHHERDEFKVTFMLYNDGTFYLQDVSINNELLSDPIVYITEIL